MPAKCELPGLQFQYPENWTLNEEELEARRESVTVYSPSGAFWSVARYPRSSDPTELALAAVNAMRQEYDSLESHETQETTGGHTLVGYDLYFYCLDMTNTAQVLTTTTGDSTYVVFHQAEDRDFEQVGPVFRAILTSLLREIGTPKNPSSTKPA